MTFDPYKLIKYHLYLLQLENYELGRFWKLLVKRGWFEGREPLRKKLVWTKKAGTLFILAEALILFFSSIVFFRHADFPFAYFWQKLLSFLVVVYILDFFTPVFLSVAAIILWPVDFIAKSILVAKAETKIKKLSLDLDPGSRLHSSGMTQHVGLKIIAIAGSYGKTTMKEVLKQVLGIRYKVLATPESVNTAVGIARWVLNKVDDAEIIIVEMGEHYRGDIKDICNITKPDIVVITGINESHMERMKSLETITATIFEAVSASKPGASIILNGDDKNVMAHYKEFVWPDHGVAEYKVSGIKYKVFDTQKLSWDADYEGIGKIEIDLLGEYALGDVDAAIKIGKMLGMSAEEIKKGIAKIKPVEHRLQPIKSANNILVIDDSYNGNPDGVAEAIKVLSRFSNRRKLFITPGLVEMGKSSESIHRKIGEQLAGVADVIILIKNSVTPWIENGINTTPSAGAATPPLQEGNTAVPRSSPPAKEGYAALAGGGGMPQIIWFNTTQEAHASLGKLLKTGDVIVFQNDWGDNYV